MHEQEASRRELDEQVLRPPRDRPYGLPFQSRDEVNRQRIAQVRTTGEHALEARALHHATQLLPGEFDLGEFRHRSAGSSLVMLQRKMRRLVGPRPAPSSPLTSPG